MQEWSKAKLSVDHAVRGELLDYVLGHEFERLLGLHEQESLGRASQKVGEIRAACGRDVVPLVLRAADVRGQPGDHVKAQRTVDVEMQFDLRKGFQVHSNTIDERRSSVY